MTTGARYVSLKNLRAVVTEIDYSLPFSFFPHLPFNRPRDPRRTQRPTEPSLEISRSFSIACPLRFPFYPPLPFFRRVFPCRYPGKGDCNKIEKNRGSTEGQDLCPTAEISMHGPVSNQPDAPIKEMSRNIPRLKGAECREQASALPGPKDCHRDACQKQDDD